MPARIARINITLNFLLGIILIYFKVIMNLFHQVNPPINCCVVVLPLEWWTEFEKVWEPAEKRTARSTC